MQFGHRGSGYAKHLSEQELHSKEAQLLVDGLLLSKDAKKFAIAREIEKVKIMPQYQLALVHSSMVLLALFSSRMINQKMDLFRKVKFTLNIVSPPFSFKQRNHEFSP